MARILASSCLWRGGRCRQYWPIHRAAWDRDLASGEANFITGVTLPVDGGALVKVG
jgi:hypothetical protein